MQLGVAHALLVTRAEAPNAVVGVSAGAINATALAEILQAGGTLSKVEDQLSVKVDRLREFINAYHEVRRKLTDAILPDSLEVFASNPLKPLESPLQFAEERATRAKANEAKSGLIDLINAFFRIRLPVSALTVMIRRVLGIIEAGEKPTWWQRVHSEVRNEAGLLFALWVHIFQIAGIFGAILWAAIWSDNWPWYRRWISNRTTAGDLLTRWSLARWLRASITVPFKVLLTSVVLTWVTALWAAIWVPLVPLIRLVRSKRTTSGKGSSRLWDRVLGYYRLCDGIASTDILKQQIIHCFDQKYYGVPEVDRVIARALDYDVKPNETTHHQRKRIGHYAVLDPHISLGIVAANVATGELEVMPPQIPIVDALTAATALVPLFPAVEIDAQLEESRAAGASAPCSTKSSTQAKRTWYIDGSNVSSQAIGPLMDYLRTEMVVGLGKGKTRVHVYPVATLPIGKKALPQREEKDTCSPDEGVIGAALRALELRRLRDATLERRLTSLYTRAIGTKVKKKVNGMTYISAKIYPIDLDEPPRLNPLQFLSSDDAALKAKLFETIAAGCRATVDAVMPGRLLDAAAAVDKAGQLIGANQMAGDDRLLREGGATICRMALNRRFGQVKELPGATESVPGVPEVCSHCSLYLAPVDGKTVSKVAQEVTGRLRSLKRFPPEWPVRSIYPSNAVSPSAYTPPKTPTAQGENPFKEFPVRSMLFGGGVFRGVYHVGVLNAANEMDFTPHVVAGSSVGAIIAAMIARVFCAPKADRPIRIGRLAATFLAIDRLVLTDRLADFVRRLTLRAGNTRFSPNDLNRVFRRFDADSSGQFSERTRKVMAGIERLLYISPFELLKLIESFREGRLTDFQNEMLGDVQSFLQRGGVGDEILGSEPLRRLIELHVLDDGAGDPRVVPLDHFRGLQFFATTTDMAAGKLVRLNGDDPATPSLLFSLLASSAFPAVFRPRYSWEVFRQTMSRSRFLDGGIIDNLPLDAVAEYLDRVLTVPRHRRPRTPHLLFTASLEVDKCAMRPDGWDVEQTRGSWRRLSSRASTFTYNRKIDAYARTQRDLRRLVKASKRGSASRQLLDLEVIAVKPKWLCGTFGFHPMLGFKRWKQAASIAHGCASTFGTMFAYGQSDPEKMRAWKVDLSDIDDKAISLREKPQSRPETGFKECEPILSPNAEGKDDGTCWFRKKKRCPFSIQELEEQDWKSDEEKTMKEELQKIYKACRIPSNHQSEERA